MLSEKRTQIIKLFPIFPLFFYVTQHSRCHSNHKTSPCNRGSLPLLHGLAIPRIIATNL